MPRHIRISKGLSVFESDYNQDGARTAGIALETTRVLVTSTVKRTTITPSGSTGGDPVVVTMDGTATTVTTGAATLATALPMGDGSATIDGLIALDILVTANPRTSAEIEAGSTTDRTTYGTIEGTDDAGTTVYLQIPFRVDQLGEINAFRMAWGEPQTPITKLVITISEMSPQSKVELITVSETT